MNSASWLHYYQQNRLNRPELQWEDPCVEEPVARRHLAKSLSHFQLGESGGGRFLLRHARRKYPGDLHYCEALALFIEEEQEHARLLKKMVERYGGRLITRHWTHSLFRGLRQALGTGFAIQVLVTAELIGTSYYRVVEGRTADPVLRHLCQIVLRDEARHVAFHAERLAVDQATWLPLERALWVAQFQMLFLATLRAAWLDHGPALRALGTRSEDFYQCARLECVQFLASCASTNDLKETVAAVHGRQEEIAAAAASASATTVHS